MATKFIAYMKAGGCCKPKPLPAGTTGQVITLDSNGDPVWATPAGGPVTIDWGVLGNAGTSDATNFAGTTDAQDFVLKSNGVAVLRILKAIAANSSGVKLEKINSSTPTSAGKSIGVDANGVIVTVPGVLKYFANIDLVAGVNYTITHNLGFANASAYFMSLRKVVDGQAVDVSVVTETANAVTVVAAANETNVNVVIIG